MADLFAVCNALSALMVSEEDEKGAVAGTLASAWLHFDALLLFPPTNELILKRSQAHQKVPVLYRLQLW